MTTATYVDNPMTPWVMIETAKRIFGRDKAYFAEPSRFDVVLVDRHDPESQALKFERSGAFSIGMWSHERQEFIERA